MNVLSIFDGMSCGQIALERAGIKVDNYSTSEIDKYSIKITKKNYPNTKQYGDVRKIRVSGRVDLLLAGSPCQGFSFAGKQLNFNDDRSKLFFEFVRILKECRAYNKDVKFLLENVLMKKEYQDVITKYLGVEPVMINSALVSAQNRKRLYWTNITGVCQPEDKGLILKDILEVSCKEKELSEAALNRMARKKYSSPKIMPEKTGTLNTKNNSGQLSFDSGTTLVPVIKSHGKLVYKPHKSTCIDANYHKGADNKGQRTGCIEVGHAEMKGHDILKRIYSSSGKCPTLGACSGGNQEKKIAIDPMYWRKLTPIECERLQTVPDNYTEGVSNTQRYKMLGNGWTIDVIVQILKGLNNGS